ncbi:MAG: hypothetical protein GY928_34860, partial [Colwellia sp.]|nr:hypothetical protein [Colwellia sp.]
MEPIADIGVGRAVSGEGVDVDLHVAREAPRVEEVAPRAVGVVVSDVAGRSKGTLDGVVAESVERVRAAVLAANEPFGEDGGPQPPTEEGEKFFGLEAESEGWDGGAREAGSGAGPGEGSQAGAVTVGEVGAGLEVGKVGRVHFGSESALNLERAEDGVADPGQETGEKHRYGRGRRDFAARGVDRPERRLVEGLGTGETSETFRRAGVPQEGAHQVSAAENVSQEGRGGNIDRPVKSKARGRRQRRLSGLGRGHGDAEPAKPGVGDEGVELPDGVRDVLGR